MISQESQHWYGGLPFKKVDVLWRDYMTSCWNRPDQAEPFLWFKDGPNLHELAHLVCASDEHILDPFWGVPFNTPFEEDAFGSRKVLMLEVEVLCVQERIETHWRGSTSPTPEIPDVVCALIGLRAMKAEGVPRHCVRAHAKTCLAKWSLETIWRELERKKTLVDAALLAL